MNATIAALIAEFGPTPGIRPLLDRGWRRIATTSAGEVVHAKPEYITGTDWRDRCWPDGFCELTDGRIVYHGYYGDVLLAPERYQPKESVQ